MPTTEKTIDIETSGEVVSLDLLGHSIVSVHIQGDGAAEYEWDVRRNGGDWIQGVREAYTGSASYNDVVETGAEEVRLRCSSGTGGADDQATITIMAS